MLLRRLVPLISISILVFGCSAARSGHAYPVPSGNPESQASDALRAAGYRAADGIVMTVEKRSVYRLLEARPHILNVGSAPAMQGLPILLRWNGSTWAMAGCPDAEMPGPVSSVGPAGKDPCGIMESSLVPILSPGDLENGS